MIRFIHVWLEPEFGWEQLIIFEININHCRGHLAFLFSPHKNNKKNGIKLQYLHGWKDWRDREEKGCVGLNTLVCVTAWEHFCWGFEGRSFVSPWVHPRLCTLGCHAPTMTQPWTFSTAPSPPQRSLQEPGLSMKETWAQRWSLVWAANHFEKELASLLGFAGASVAGLDQKAEL